MQALRWVAVLFWLPLLVVVGAWLLVRSILAGGDDE